MNTRLVWLVSSIVLVILALGGAVYLLQDRDEAVEASLTVEEALTGDTTGYRRATRIRPLVFPEDHGPHPEYKTEWWYLTGNLEGSDGRRFGYQLTVFRIALRPPGSKPPSTTSAWTADQVYMGHFAVTDVARRSFTAYERFARGAAGLAGAQASPFRVWVEDWTMEGGQDSLFPLQISARREEIGIDLRLEPVKDRVLQGNQGLDRKGPGAGNASYYYSYPRLRTQGTITTDGVTDSARGFSWMDREWSTSALGEHQTGWDWFALHLSDGTDLMYYQIRRKDGTASPYTSGVLVDSTGRVTSLDRSSVNLRVLDTWRSSSTGVEYPGSWRLSVPDHQLELTIRPVLQAQELDVSVRYWEGAVEVSGIGSSQPLEGTGYVELTGYGDASGGSYP